MLLIYKLLAKFLLSYLKSFISTWYTIKDPLAFSEEIVKQDPENFMGILDFGSHLINIPLEETIDICTNTFFDNKEKVEGLPKIEFKGLLSLATKDFNFIFIAKL